MVVLLFCACGDDSATGADAAIDSSPGTDAPRVDAPPDAFSTDGHCMGDGGMGTRHEIYLVFEGVTLMAGNEDARSNTTGLVSATSTVPPFAANAANRQQFINDITSDVRLMLNGYNVDVVTTRPTSGDYTMIVFATANSVGLQQGVAAIGASDCGNANADNVAIVVDMGTTGGLTAIFYADLVMFDVGLTIGAGTNQLPGDCMNDNGGTGSSLCTLSNGVMVHQGCNQGATQNEQEIFADQLGCL
jgi:hypothetical protein